MQVLDIQTEMFKVYYTDWEENTRKWSKCVLITSFERSDRLFLSIIDFAKVKRLTELVHAQTVLYSGPQF